MIVVGDLMADVVAAVASPLAHALRHARRRSPPPGRRRRQRRRAAGRAPACRRCWSPASARTRPAQAALAELRAGGVELEVAIDPRAPTGTCIVIVEPGGERTMLPDRGANAALEPADLPIDEFAEGKHLHLSGYTLLDPGSRSAGLVALEHARAAGMTISVDPGLRGAAAAVGAARLPGLDAPRRPAAPERARRRRC